MIGWLQQMLFEYIVQPVLFGMGWTSLAEELFDLCEWFVLGMVEVAALAVVLGTLERLHPIETVKDGPEVRTDIIYTLIHRLGLFGLVAFACVGPVVDALHGWLALHGIGRPNIDQIRPGLTDLPAVSFLIYAVILDLADYWIHRAQHRFGWWWHLHAVHHSQRQMTFWSDSRNHLLDSLMRDALLAFLSVFIGVAPEQFVLLTLLFRALQSLQHANLRLRLPFGTDRILVGPGFHRLHHAIEPSLHANEARGVNFGVLFPWWDALFGTADWREGFVATGIDDQLRGRDYGRGFWAQQWRALLRLAGRA